MLRILASRLTVYLFCTFCIIMMPGCADDLRNRHIFDCGAGETIIRFSVEDLNLTRDGESVDIESAIDHAYLLFYPSDASLITDAPIAAVKADVDLDVPGNLKFKMPLSLQPNTDYQLLAIANADVYTPSGYDNFGQYLESWCQTSSSDKIPLHLSCLSPISPANNANLPMNGGIEGGSSFRFSIENGVYTVTSSLTFRRLVARIDVANIVKEGFTVEGIALCNWRDAVPVATFDSQLGNSFGAVQGSISNEGDSFDEDRFIEMPEANENGIQQLNKKLYCFPSVSYDAFIGDQSSTAIIIKAKYGEDTESSYYRVNVGLKGNLSKVNPNTKYLVTIRSVRGRGAASPQEAYFTEDSQIVLSIVEGWDLEGNAFDMDDNGNFIVLSKGSLVFAGNSNDREEVRILTSKGLQWSAEYIADDEISTSAFEVTNVLEASVVISPRGINEENVPLTGKCRISATTSQGNSLKVDISLRQEVDEEKPDDPGIPENLPFALIPVNGDRVKIDHNAKTIEIDGFDPDCFNSFIDIPFRVFINNNNTTATQLTISSTLEWPLEGRVSLDSASEYSYCKESFAVTGSKGVMKSDGSVTTDVNLGNGDIRNVKDQIIYISIGAMGPDDPAIVDRNVKLTASNGSESIAYNLIIKPRQAIIDDVILNDGSGKAWLIMDRNMQDFNISNYVDYIGVRSDGKRFQAYNYTYYFIRSDASYNAVSINIPFKFRDTNTNFTETEHVLYEGKVYMYKDRNSLISNDGNVVSISSWLKKYCNSSESVITSPFYKIEDCNNWILPDKSVLELCCSKLRVSKMRMFLVSDVPVKNGKSNIPVCCYLPYHCFNFGEDSNDSYGYYATSTGKDPDVIYLLFFDNKAGKLIKMSSSTQKAGLTRLVRPLGIEELNEYKDNYLGYGNIPHRLTICHPDTYGSEGWIKY